MAELLRVPEVATGAEEVVVADWLVQPGETFQTGDPLVVVETEKAIVEIPAEHTQTLLHVLMPAGSTAEVGSPIGLLGSSDEASGDIQQMLVDLGANGIPPAGTEGLSPTEPGALEPNPAPPDTPSQSQPQQAQGRIFISPIARKMLAEAGIAPQEVAGTGPNGRIRRRDAEAAIEAHATTTPECPVPQTGVDSSGNDQPETRPSSGMAGEGATWTETPHSRQRAAVARRLTASKQEIPHFYVKRTVRVDALLKLRAQLNDVTPAKISLNDLLLRAVAVTHTAVPEANVTWTDHAMRHYASVDVAVAIASRRGLVTPVLRAVGNSPPSAISAQVRTFVQQADAGRLQQADLEGGSIALSNLGMYGVDEFSAIINPPQSAILAVGATRQTPIVNDDVIAVATTMDLVLSVDHRAIDGELAAKWMGTLVDCLEQPLRLVA